MHMVSVSAPTYSSVSGKLQTQQSLKPLQPVTGTPAPDIHPSEIEWAKKLDSKMEYGYIPSKDEQQRYSDIVNKLQAIRDGGGYVYEDKTSFSNNPRGFSAIGSLIGRTISGGFIGYRYSHDMANITHTTYTNIKQGITSGQPLSAVKSLAVGVKQAGAISLKAGAISSAVNAGTSVVANIAETIAGRQTGSEAVGNVAADTVGGFLSGVGASIFSGASTLGLSLAGTAGLPLTIVGVAGGVVGSLLLDKAYKASGLFTVVKGKVMGLLEKKDQQTRPVSQVPQLPPLPVKAAA